MPNEYTIEKFIKKSERYLRTPCINMVLKIDDEESENIRLNKCIGLDINSDEYDDEDIKIANYYSSNKIPNRLLVESSIFYRKYIVDINKILFNNDYILTSTTCVNGIEWQLIKEAVMFTVNLKLEKARKFFDQL